MARDPFIGIGVDLEVISRFRALPYQRNVSFYRKLFTPREIRYCLRYRDPAPHFAARFAAKEALFKALGGAARDFKNVEVNMKNGRPQLERPGFAISLSLAHTRDLALAAVAVFRDRLGA